LGDAPVNPSLIQPWLEFNPPPQMQSEQDDGQPEVQGDEQGKNEEEDEQQGDGQPAFGDENRPPDFGKAFGLPPIYSLMDA
jgi:hypothetical protein